MKVIICAGNKTAAITDYINSQPNMSITAEPVSSAIELVQMVGGSGMLVDKLIVFGCSMDQVEGQDMLDLVFETLGQIADNIGTSKEIVIINSNERMRDFSRQYFKYLHGIQRARFVPIQRVPTSKLESLIVGNIVLPEDQGYRDIKTTSEDTATGLHQTRIEMAPPSQTYNSQPMTSQTQAPDFVVRGQGGSVQTGAPVSAPTSTPMNAPAFTPLNQGGAPQPQQFVQRQGGTNPLSMGTPVSFENITTSREQEMPMEEIYPQSIPSNNQQRNVRESMGVKESREKSIRSMEQEGKMYQADAFSLSGVAAGVDTMSIPQAPNEMNGNHQVVGMPAQQPVGISIPQEPMQSQSALKAPPPAQTKKGGLFKSKKSKSQEAAPAVQPVQPQQVQQTQVQQRQVQSQPQSQPSTFSRPAMNFRFDPAKVAAVQKRQKIIVLTGNERSGVSGMLANMAMVGQAAGIKILILDLDLYGRGMSLYFPQDINPEENFFTNGIANAMRSPYNFKSYVWDITPNLDILGLDLSVGDIKSYEDSLTGGRLSDLVSNARTQYDLILIDMPFKYINKFATVIGTADRIAYVSENDVPSLVNVANKIQPEVFETMVDYQMFRSKCGFILNKYNPASTMNDNLIEPSNFTLFLDNIVEGADFDRYPVFGSVEYVRNYVKQFDGGTLLCESKGFDQLFFDMLYTFYK